MTEAAGTARESVREGGIACPACGLVEQYAGKTNDKRPDNTIYRTKECKCGVRFATLEVPIGVVEVHRRNRGKQDG